MSIQFNEATKTFTLRGRRSWYAIQVDEEGRVRHLGQGALPANIADDCQISGEIPTQQPHIWGIDTRSLYDEVQTFGDLSCQEVTLKVNFPLIDSVAPAEAPHDPVRDVRLRYQSHEIVDDVEPALTPAHGQPTLVSETRETLMIRMRDPERHFKLNLFLRLTPEHDIIERWMELENQERVPITVEQCYFGTVNLPHGHYDLTYVAGQWGHEFRIQREELHFGVKTLENRSVQTGHEFGPFYLVNERGRATDHEGAAYFGALVYGGNWRLSFEHLGNRATRIHGGYSPFDFELVLAPGQRHTTPAMVHGISDDGIDGASRRMQAFARERILPRPERELAQRPVLFDSWEAVMFDVNYESQKKLAEIAASVGVELFSVDDGWFGGRRHDAAGLGDWWPSPELFPQGLKQLADDVHKLGMQFGIWVEPEMVNPDSELYRAHPDWVLHFPGRPRTEFRNQLILDFGRPEVVEFIEKAMDDLVTQFDVDYFKWDMNRRPMEPGSVVGKAIWLRHNEALYAMLDRLRKRHPGLDIQSCSGGGGRIDLAILGRVDQVWTSDNTDAYDRIGIQEGYLLAYPARAMECWVTHSPNPMIHRLSPLSLRFDIAMRGVLGLGDKLDQLPEEELAEYRRYVAFYKKIRHIVQDGVCYCIERPGEYGASILQYLTPDASESVYSMAVERHEFLAYRPRPRLRGLDPAARYTVSDYLDQTVGEYSGFDLMTMGLPGDTDYLAGQSRTLYLRRVESPSKGRKKTRRQ